MPTILVVDDLLADRSLISALVAKHPGWDVVTAEDGKQALDVMRRELVDAVVTDLQMPEIDGLKLVSVAVREFPNLPVVLVTSQGSEEIAVRALREGAASYVPKRLMRRELVETLAGVLEVASRRRQSTLVMRFLRQHQRNLEFVLPTDFELVGPMVSFLQDAISEMGVCGESESLRVGIALGEAMNNAVYHGNLQVDSQLKEQPGDAFMELANQRRRESPYCDRTVYVGARLSADEAHIVLRDEGPGFNPEDLPDPEDPENLMRLSGRGLILMRTFMDEVHFNDRGNEVTLIKRRPCEAA